MKTKLLLSVLLGGLQVAGCKGVNEEKWLHFRGMCDASAMEMLNDDLFVVANDEDNVLRVYSRSTPGLPVQSLDFTSFYRLRRDTHEIDLEGAARIGDRIYWISSHGANAKGKFQPSRHRFFATRAVSSNGVPQLEPVGQLYATLLSDLVSHPDLAGYNLVGASQRPPKSKNALNIEGLAPTPEGHLLIGFRNPIPGGKALLVPLINPEEVTAGKRAIFGKALLLDLNGLGIRSITAYSSGYLVVAGTFDGKGKSKLYHWDGKSPSPTPASRQTLAANPEGVAVVESDGEKSLFVLSDDGTRKIGNEDCKKIKDNTLRNFRAYEVPLGYLED